ncbi:Hypothetical_protein [Hexamita inflata]|uniref:Hypothetical_protein n=1 Tax=Hexamita inflata TaxID=28002 RepID=A0AA86PEH2_9EUKA|nr:Hypothetical protein HINF_LOCUS25445 [Hexamita inflata]
MTIKTLIYNKQTHIIKLSKIVHNSIPGPAIAQMRKQNHLDWKKDENHFNQLEIHQPQELLKYILFLLGYGKITSIYLYIAFERLSSVANVRAEEALLKYQLCLV